MARATAPKGASPPERPGERKLVTHTDLEVAEYAPGSNGTVLTTWPNGEIWKVVGWTNQGDRRVCEIERVSS